MPFPHGTEPVSRLRVFAFHPDLDVATFHTRSDS